MWRLKTKWKEEKWAICEGFRGGTCFPLLERNSKIEVASQKHPSSKPYFFWLIRSKTGGAKVDPKSKDMESGDPFNSLTS